jgi:hypothetical protein
MIILILKENSCKIELYLQEKVFQKKTNSASPEKKKAELFDMRAKSQEMFIGNSLGKEKILQMKRRRHKKYAGKHERFFSFLICLN